MRLSLVLIVIISLQANTLCGRSISVSPAVKQLAAGDTSKKYPIDDPRNPDCPCHKYQKLADEEYKRLQEEEKEKHDRSADKNTYSDVREHKIKQKRTDNGIFKMKRRKTFLYKLKILSRHQGRQRRQHGNSNCSHW